MRRAQQLGRYHLLDRIAFGGMAEIYRAKTFDGNGQPHLVAVKRVLAHLADGGDTADAVFGAYTALPPPEVQALPLHEIVSSGPAFTVVAAGGIEAVADTFT